MSGASREVDLDGPGLLRLLVQRSWLVVLLVLVGGGAGVAYAETRPTEFTAEQQLVQTGQVLDPLLVSLANQSIDPNRLVQTQVDILNGSSLETAVERELGEAPEELETQTTEQSDVILAQVTSRTAEVAERDLEAYVSAFLNDLEDQEADRVDAALDSYEQQLAEIEDQLEQVGSNDEAREAGLVQQQIEVLSNVSELRAARDLGAASVETVGRVEMSEFTPSTARTAVIGAAAGLLTAVLMILLLAQLRPRRQ